MGEKFQEHQESADEPSGAASSEGDLSAARAEGAQALRDAMGPGEAILVMDEISSCRLYNAYAVGWNTEWMKELKRPHES